VFTLTLLNRNYFKKYYVPGGLPYDNNKMNVVSAENLRLSIDGEFCVEYSNVCHIGISLCASAISDMN